MDILLVINPLSPCIEVYTILSQRGYLSGVLSDNRTGKALSEIFKQIMMITLRKMIQWAVKKDLMIHSRKK